MPFGKEAHAAWRNENRDRIRAAQRRWRAKHRDALNAAARARRAENAPARALLRAARAEAARVRGAKQREAAKKNRLRRARAEADWAYLATKQLKRHPQPRANRSQLTALWASQGGRCGLTGATIPPGVRPHIDHKVPVSRGGSSLPDNLHFVHPMANHAKNSHSEQEFREWLLAAADALRQKIALEALL